MSKKLKTKAYFGLTLLVIAAFIVASVALGDVPRANAQAAPVLTVTGYTGTVKTYSLTELQNMPNVTMYGGYYQPNQKQINSGNWIGISLLTLCNQVGGLNPSCTVSVIGQGTNNFTYNMIANGQDFNSAYKTYNNATGTLQNQTQPITAILAYQVNGTTLPSSMQPAPRLVIVGPEGLLFEGSGGRSITQVNITSTEPTPTPTPTATTSPKPEPTATPSPAPTAMPTPTPEQTATTTPEPTTTVTSTPTTTSTPTPAPIQTESPTPTTSPTASPTASASQSAKPETNQNLTTVYLAVAAVAIIVIVVAIGVFLRRKK